MNNTIAKLEFAQICWVIPDIYVTIDFLSNSLGIAFPKPELVRAQALNMSYYGKVVNAEWLTAEILNTIYRES